MTAQLDLSQVPASMRMGPTPFHLHQKVWEKVGWKPYDLQRNVLKSKTRLQVLAAGRRAGKSQVGGMKLVPEAFRAFAELEQLEERGLRREFWIVGPEYSDAEKEFRVVWNAFKRLGFDFDKPGSYNNTEAGQMRISMFDGRFIIDAKSAKYPGTLVGEGLSGVVFSEAAKLKPSVWLKFIRPTLADFLGWAFFSSTPEGKNWFYDLWMIGQDKTRPDWQSWRAPSWVNPYVYPGGADYDILLKAIEARRKGQLENFKNTMKFITSISGVSPTGIHPEIWSMFLDQSDEAFNQEVACLFTEYVGRVFKNFDEEFHVNQQEYRLDWTTWAVADYGFSNPFVWLIIQVSPHRDRVHVLEEYYERGRTTEEAGREIMSRGLVPHHLMGFYPDPAEPDRTRTLSQMFHVKAMSPGSLTITDRIEWIRRGLKFYPPHLQAGHPERAPGLTIHSRCVNTIREFNDYRYKETYEQSSLKGRAAPENPLKKDDHTPEALGRFYSGAFGSPYGRGTRQSRADVRR